MYEFWYDYIKPKYQDRAKLCYMDTDSFVIHIKNDDFMKTLMMTLKSSVTHQTTAKMIIDCFQQVGMKKKSVFLKMNQVERL